MEYIKRISTNCFSDSLLNFFLSRIYIEYCYIRSTMRIRNDTSTPGIIGEKFHENNYFKHFFSWETNEFVKGSILEYAGWRNFLLKQCCHGSTYFKENDRGWESQMAFLYIHTASINIAKSIEIHQWELPELELLRVAWDELKTITTINIAAPKMNDASFVFFQLQI